MNLAWIGLALAAMLGMMLVGMPMATSMALVGIVGGIAAYGAPFMDSIAPVIFFFSSRRLHTRLSFYWSSDVCSSDLEDHFFFFKQKTAYEIIVCWSSDVCSS